MSSDELTPKGVAAFTQYLQSASAALPPEAQASISGIIAATSGGGKVNAASVENATKAEVSGDGVTPLNMGDVSVATLVQTAYQHALSQQGTGQEPKGLDGLGAAVSGLFGSGITASRTTSIEKPATTPASAMPPPQQAKPQEMTQADLIKFFSKNQGKPT